MKVVMKKTSIFVDIIKDSEIEFLYIYFLTIFFQIKIKLNHWLRYKNH